MASTRNYQQKTYTITLEMEWEAEDEETAIEEALLSIAGYDFTGRITVEECSNG